MGLLMSLVMGLVVVATRARTLAHKVFDVATNVMGVVRWGKIIPKPL